MLYISHPVIYNSSVTTAQSTSDPCTNLQPEDLKGKRRINQSINQSIRKRNARCKQCKTSIKQEQQQPLFLSKRHREWHRSPRNTGTWRPPPPSPETGPPHSIPQCLRIPCTCTRLLPCKRSTSPPMRAPQTELHCAWLLVVAVARAPPIDSRPGETLCDWQPSCRPVCPPRLSCLPQTSSCAMSGFPLSPRVAISRDLIVGSWRFVRLH